MDSEMATKRFANPPGRLEWREGEGLFKRLLQVSFTKAKSVWNAHSVRFWGLPISLVLGGRAKIGGQKRLIHFA
ncbi:hypothetical protein ACLKA6_013334 [Drosophila palustris]